MHKNIMNMLVRIQHTYKFYCIVNNKKYIVDRFLISLKHLFISYPINSSN